VAQTMWVNYQLSAAADQGRGKHTAIGGVQNAGDCTFSFDPAKLTSLNALDNIQREVRAWCQGAGLK
jgi:hypothetical protein